MQNFTVAASLAYLLIDMLPVEARNLDQLCQQAGIRREDLDHPDKRMPKPAFMKLAVHIAAQLDDEELALLTYQNIHPGTLQIVGYLMLSSNSMLQALQKLQHYAPLLDESLEVELRREAQGYRLSLHPRDNSAMPRILMDAELMTLFGFLTQLRNGRPLLVHELTLTYTDPGVELLRWIEMQQIRLLCGADRISMLLDAQQLEEERLPVSPMLAEVHQRLADYQLEELRANYPVYLRVRQLIIERLEQRAPTIEEIAEALHMTPRSLQRALQTEGYQYRQLLSDARQEMARLLLCHTGYPIKEVAFRLGFRELSSFHRFCMRWFGATPLQLRREGKGGAQCWPAHGAGQPDVR
ncbi:MAG: AraC family transcriptional regulator [Ramlibacter sp.]|nr:AraC family transcriptional regulator [Ramlibacter sp.]